MKRSCSISVLLLCGLLMLSLCSVLLCSCDGRHHVEGVTWQAPDDKVMPLAFRDNEDMPAYAKRWRMPEGFHGFPARWNEKVKAYLERSIETKTEELKRSMSQHLSAVPGSDEHRRSGVRAQSDRLSLANLMERSRMGDYLVFRRPKDLPDHLVWQDGADEPELGSPEARKGGTLRLPLQRSFPNTLRPFGPNSNNATRRYVYDDIDLPLVRIHPGTGHLIPGTADRWAVSQDNRTVYFHIDPKACFSNGKRLTSRDYICSLFVRTSTFAQEPFYGSYYMGNFARITVYGDEYLAVTLNAPRPYAPVYASIPACCTSFYAEFGPDYTTRYLWRVAPTTGAYTILPDGLNMGRSMVLSRVKDWWASDRKFTRYSCNVDNIVYLFVTETSKVRELFRIGRLDVFSARDADVWYEGMEIDPVYRGLIQRVRFNNIWPRNCFGWHLNVSKPPFNNRDVRLGFHHALNVQSVINTVFRGDYSRLGSYFSGFGKYTDTGIRALPFSPEKARRYFARAGYTEEADDGILCKPDGTRLQVVVSSRIDSLYANCMNMLREDAAKCGLDLRLEQMDDTVFYLKVKEKKHSAAIFSWGFSPPLPDASAFFLSEYAVKEDGTPLPGTNNITATASPELDAAILDCRMATTEQEMVEAQYRVQRLIADTAAWVPGWTTSYWRFAQWRWLRWPDTPECRFCPPRYYDPLDSHLYWIDEDIKRETLEARTGGGSFPESQIDVPLPEAQATPPRTAIMNPHPLLEVRNLSVAFESDDGLLLRAVDDVSFSIARGECVGIVGESGCGKSVTAMSLVRLLPKPAGQILSGEVLFDGEEVLSMPANRLHELRGGRVGIIFQEPMQALNPVHTIGNQIAESLMLHRGLTADAAWVEAVNLLRLVHIPNPDLRALDYPHSLSGGMRQRVVIAIALACRPQLIIADEPTTALDVTVQQQILNLLRELRQDLTASSLLITHDLGVIAQNCDRVLVMYAGRIVESAPVTELFVNPRHAYTKALLASMPRRNYERKSLLPTIPGNVAPIREYVQGCRFCQRMGVPTAKLTVRPPLVEVAPGHWVENCPRCAAEE